MAFPEGISGLLPHGGASYYLSHMENGWGMYLALTGAGLTGEDVFWAGLTKHFGFSADAIAASVAKAMGMFVSMIDTIA